MGEYGMNDVRIIGKALPNIPWEERPHGNRDVVWRYGKNPIIPRNPFPGAKVKKNRMVYFTITSIVPEKTPMPDLRDLTLRQAQTMLEAAGLKAGKIMYIRSFDADAVQNQYFDGHPIKPGTLINKGSVITLSVGMGARGTEAQKDSLETDEP